MSEGTGRRCGARLRLGASLAVGESDGMGGRSMGGGGCEGDGSGGGSVVAGLRHGMRCRVRWIERWVRFRINCICWWMWCRVQYRDFVLVRYQIGLYRRPIARERERESLVGMRASKCTIDYYRVAVKGGEKAHADRCFRYHTYAASMHTESSRYTLERERLRICSTLSSGPDQPTHWLALTTT